jgi:superfamily I DNA/RNA helicase
MKISLIYGPPGTGKTHTLIDILEREVRDGVPLRKIAFVAFSRKAAYEAQDRVRAHFQCEEVDLMHVRTIHSMSFRAAKANAAQMMDPGKYRDFGVKSGFSLRGYYSVDEGFTSKDDDFIGLEQLYRNNPRYCDKILDNIDHKRFVAYMGLYRKYKDTFRYLDFTDLLELYLQKDNMEDVEVAIVDEAQDLTTLQWRVIMKAFRGVKRMYIAGDDDQAIFEWAGADINAFLHLKGDSRVLEYSYRLPQLLINEARRITKLITKRIDKVYNGADTAARFSWIGNVEDCKFNEGESYYLLARNNFLLKQYIQHCVDEGVLFKVKGKDYLTKTDLKAIKSGDDLSEWEPEKIAYANRLISKNILNDEPLINISTVHAVKGGEADHVVIMTDISHGVQKQLEWDEDSEHRVFYVGITRAKKSVTAILPSTKYNYPYLR